MKKTVSVKNGVALAKMPTGLGGFDNISEGGLPRGRTTLITGGPGCGKSIFALQTLVNGAKEWNEPGTSGKVDYPFGGGELHRLFRSRSRFCLDAGIGAVAGCPAYCRRLHGLCGDVLAHA